MNDVKLLSEQAQHSVFLCAICKVRGKKGGCQIRYQYLLLQMGKAHVFVWLFEMVWRK
jgi:hypothetical protein